MINQIIQLLQSRNCFKNKLKSDKLSYILLSSGGYRQYDKSRFVVIIFDKNEPKLIVKFFKSSRSITDEYRIHTQIFKIYGNLISKPLGIESFDDYELLIEEPVLGKNLSRYVFEHLNSQTLSEIFKSVSDFYKELNSKLELSNFQNFNKELDCLIQTFYSNFKITHTHENLITNLRSIFLKNFENKKIFHRFSNNDFILNNFIIYKNKIILTDFEFSTKTHFYFLDWFKFFRYQWIVSNDYVFDLTMSETTDPFYELGLREFSNYKIDNKFELSCRLIFEIHDFINRINVSSFSTKKILNNDMKKFLDDLNFRFHNPKILQKKIDSISSEKLFFKSEFKKLTNYKKFIDELTDLRISNDERSLELRNTFKLLDTASRNFNEQKFLYNNLRISHDELREDSSKLRLHNDELREEVSKLRLHNDELREEVSKLRLHNDELRDEIKRIIFDHDNYKFNVENGTIWKFMNTLSKLSGKK